jgi:hypothetical protein
MPHPSKEKGSRAELEVKRRHDELGCLRVTKMPLSGSLGGDWKGDLKIEITPAESFSGEVKARKKSCWKTVARWLGKTDILFLKEDWRLPIVVMSWSTYASIMQRIGTFGAGPDQEGVNCDSSDEAE